MIMRKPPKPSRKLFWRPGRAYIPSAVTRAINERGSHLALCHELEAEAA